MMIILFMKSFICRYKGVLVSTNYKCMVLFQIPIFHSYVNRYMLIDKDCLPGGDCHEHDYKE